MLFLLPLFILLLPVALGDQCGTIPPDLWCGNAEIEKTCGFQQQCDRYRAGTKNKPVQVTLLMEAFCPGCQAFITETLYPKIYKNFAGFVEIEIVPYGNAKVKNGTIVCQHGEDECFVNKFESCLIDSMQTQDKFVPYIYCLELQLKQGTEFEPASRNCFEKLSVDQDTQRMIQSCLVSELGNKLQKKAGERTDGVWPEKHTHVPWILVNNVSLDSLQNQMDNLPSLICQWYNGDKKIPYCEQERRKKMRKVSKRLFFY